MSFDVVSSDGIYSFDVCVTVHHCLCDRASLFV